MGNECEEFYGILRKINDSTVITIPSKLMKFSGLKQGEAVKIIIRKHDVFKREE